MNKKYYKGFDAELKCKGFAYEVGKTYTHKGPISLCNSGFHACADPFDVLKYYDITSRFAEVTLSGSITSASADEDSKVVASGITIIKELSLSDFIKVCTESSTASGKGSKIYASGTCSKLAASGPSSKLTASGACSTLMALGQYSTLISSGSYCNLASSGYGSTLAASGYYSKLSASGPYSKLAASGSYSKLTASGVYSELTASGAYSELTASGPDNELFTSGYGSKLTASGPDNALISSGGRATIAASGKNSVAMASGANSRVKGGKNCALALTFLDRSGKTRISVAYTGENGIKENTWYKLDDEGNFVETQ